MFLMLFLAFFLNCQANINQALAIICPDYDGIDGVEDWEDVPDEDWYWGFDWQNHVENNTQKDGVTEGEIYPAGFRSYLIGWHNEPTVCIKVPSSRNKKVEILVESEMSNANLCIHDAQDNTVSTNDVGNVDNCGTGKLYACFTAATAEGNQDLGVYIYCESGCEDSAQAIWLRVRISKESWNSGKTDTASDLEHWCERERGTTFEDDDDNMLMYTYPSDLIPDEPSQWPFHIQHIFGKNAATHTSPSYLWVVPLVAGVLCYLL